MTKQRNVVVRVLKSFVEMFWVFSIGSQELKENLLLAPERDNKASFDITPHKIAPIKSSANKVGFGIHQNGGYYPYVSSTVRQN
jgi:hypothetical protein